MYPRCPAFATRARQKAASTPSETISEVAGDVVRQGENLG
jgi:hypothetical protein